MSFRSLHSRIAAASKIVAALGGLSIIFISVMITLDVVLRKFAGVTLGGASEIAGTIFAAATALSYTYVLIDRANIRIDVLYLLAGSRLRSILDTFALFAFLFFSIQVVRSTYLVFEKSWSGNSQSLGTINFPLWVPQIIWFSGYVFMALTAAFLCAYTLFCLLRHDWNGVIRIAGIPSIEEAIKDETGIDASGNSDAGPVSATQKGDR